MVAIFDPKSGHFRKPGTNPKKGGPNFWRNLHISGQICPELPLLGQNASFDQNHKVLWLKSTIRDDPPA